MRTSHTISIAFAIAALTALGGCASLHTSPADGDSTTTASAPTTVPIPVATLLSEAQSQNDDDTSIAIGQQFANLTSPDANLWNVVRRGFSLPDGNETQVREQIAFFESRMDFIRHTVQRAEPYLYYVVTQLTERGMPTDLALLPVIESGYQPYAYSPGHAAGMWQFISSTGRLYGLEQNSWYDGRLDIVASTNAALKYLQNLNDQFNGNWLLALAAYNSGSLTVQRAIDYNRRHGLPTDFWHLNLPAQTRAYVPRLLAVRDIIAHPSKYGLDLPFIANAPYLAKIDLKGQLDLAVAAQLAGMDLKTLYHLNPGYSRWATPPDGPSTLLIPVDDKQRFLAALDDMQLERMPAWSSHRVRSGETLSGIAANYHTSVAALRDHNGLHGSLIRVGTTLKVPTGSSDQLRYVTGGSVTVAHNYTPPTPSRHSETYSHIYVHSGDTLWGLAQHYHVSVADLARWNQISTHTRLRTGERLALLSGVATAAEESSTSQSGSSHYVVERGDSLSVIASRFGVSVHDLEGWNSLSTASVIQPGQRLVIRGGTDAGSSSSPTHYVVKRGDSLSAIASNFGVSVHDLEGWNSLSSASVLQPGQRLVIERGAEAVASNGPRQIHYVVKQGDSLYGISNHFNVSLAKLADWNSLSVASILHPGQLLTVFVSATN